MISLLGIRYPFFERIYFVLFSTQCFPWQAKHAPMSCKFCKFCKLFFYLMFRRGQISLKCKILGKTVSTHRITLIIIIIPLKQCKDRVLIKCSYMYYILVKQHSAFTTNSYSYRAKSPRLCPCTCRTQILNICWEQLDIF